MVEKKLDGLENDQLEPYDEADSEQNNNFNENIENEIKQQSNKTKKNEPKKGWGGQKTSSRFNGYSHNTSLNSSKCYCTISKIGKL